MKSFRGICLGFTLINKYLKLGVKKLTKNKQINKNNHYNKSVQQDSRMGYNALLFMTAPPPNMKYLSISPNSQRICRVNESGESILSVFSNLTYRFNAIPIKNLERFSVKIDKLNLKSTRKSKRIRIFSFEKDKIARHDTL